MTQATTDIAFLDTPGCRTAYRRVGQGAPLVLIHGGEADHHMFDAMLPALARHCDVVAYDQRDSGQTQNGDAAYGPGEMADDVAALIAGLGWERAHVFGTSLGGTIAQMVAARHPRRIDRLVLASTWQIGRTLAQFNPEVARELAGLRQDMARNAARIASYFFTPAFIDAHPEVLNIFTQNNRTPAQRERRAAMQAGIAHATLGRISAPTLLLAGAADRLIPPTVTFALQTQIPHAQTALVDAAPHVGAIACPGALVEQLQRFLQDR
jgi:pimeloyl-ACP methyl ester carboxylesterase